MKTTGAKSQPGTPRLTSKQCYMYKKLSKLSEMYCFLCPKKPNHCSILSEQKRCKIFLSAIGSLKTKHFSNTVELVKLSKCLLNLLREYKTACLGWKFLGVVLRKTMIRVSDTAQCVRLQRYIQTCNYPYPTSQTRTNSIKCNNVSICCVFYLISFPSFQF